MSTINVEATRITSLNLHPNADRLEVAEVFGTTVVVPKGQFKAGQMVVYFPPNVLIPEDVAKQLGVHNYLKHAVYPGDVISTQCRVAATKLRGVPSYGFVVRSPKLDATEGCLFNHYYKATKYTPPIKTVAGDALPDHPLFHEYTDIENYWRYPDAIEEGTPVRITEKIHGMNSRAGIISVGGDHFEFMAGSHHCNVKEYDAAGRRSRYWLPFEYEPILRLLTWACDEQKSVILFGEIMGPGIQDMDYGLTEPAYRVFDLSENGQYYDWEILRDACDFFGVPTVPLLYEGPFYKGLVDKFVSGPTLGNFGPVRSQFKGREGIVITPLKESWSPALNGRSIVKAVSAEYLDRKGAQDN